MSIAALHQVYDESRRLAIAGSQLAKGDFRLEKLLAPLKKSGAKAPVFLKVAEAVEKVIGSPETDSGTALLDLVTLVSAVLYTQGETGAKGSLADLKNTDLGIHSTRATARVLAPLQEALTTTGSGRMEIIKDAHRRGAFKDMRLVLPALGALDDGYGEIAEFVTEKVLPQYGNGILVAVRQTFDPKGKGGHARRLRLMHAIDPKGSRDTVLDAFENGSKEVKIAAVACLGTSKEDLPLLLEQAKARAKEVRAAALEALAGFKEAEAVEVLKEALAGKDFQIATGPIQKSRSAELLNHVLTQAKALLRALTSGEVKQKDLEAGVERLHGLLDCFEGRLDKKIEAFLIDVFNQRGEIAKAGASPDFLINSTTDLLLEMRSEAGLKLMAEAVFDFSATTGDCILAHCLTHSPKESFKALSPMLQPPRKAGSRKKQTEGEVMSQILEGILIQIVECAAQAASDPDVRECISSSYLEVTLDPAWLDLAVKQGNASLSATLSVLNPGNRKLHKFLPKAFAQTKEEYECAAVLSAMIRIGHPKAADLLVERIKKAAKGRTHYYYWLYFDLIEELPQAEAPKIEALLGELPDAMVDRILPHFTALTSKS